MLAYSSNPVSGDAGHATRSAFTGRVSLAVFRPGRVGSVTQVKIALFAGSLRGGGGKSVGVNLVRSLPPAGSDHEYLMFVPPDDDCRAAAFESGSEVVEVPSTGAMRRMVWESARGGRLASKWGAEWVVALGNVPIRFSGKSAVLLHDTHLFYPWSAMGHLSRRRKVRKRLLRAKLRSAIRSQAAVLAQTRAAAARIESAYGVRNICVVPNTVSSLITDAVVPTVPMQLPAAGFRFLTLTRYGGRKGLDTLADMFESHAGPLEDVVGIITIDPADGPAARRLLERLATSKTSGGLHNVWHVPQAQLRSLYGQVDAIVLSTQLESMSATYVEAMALGVPIITSDRDFARDVCGDAALYVDPDVPADIAAAIRRLADDDALRRRLVASGLQRADGEQATWADAAGAVVRALEHPSSCR